MEKLHKLLNMRAGVFTVLELKTLLLLADGNNDSVLNWQEQVNKIYERLRNTPKEQGGLEGGYQY